MKIKTKALPYSIVKNLPKYQHKKPLTPSIFFRTLLKVVGNKDLKETNFTYQKINMEKLAKDEPALFLMNHSSFIDLEIATNILYPRPFNIVCTSDGFVGKEWLMRHLGCIPTKKFIADATLVRDMVYASKKNKASILMYPEASYTFDGTATPLPDGLAKCIKMLKIPVIMIKTEGAFTRDPLYNMLQKRKINVKATMEYILSPDQINTLSTDEIMGILKQQFTFDGFKWQQDKNIIVNEPFRADGLNRVLYKCPSCHSENDMVGKGITLTCNHCHKKWELTETGYLKSEDNIDIFNHIPDWYKWERECVKKELLENKYLLDIPVVIRIMRDMKKIYEIGEGRLIHDMKGFHLTGDNGNLEYHHKPTSSYSLYSDYFWYELGDVICIGDSDTLYYCFPKIKRDIVAKTRLATEELFKLLK